MDFKTTFILFIIISFITGCTRYDDYLYEVVSMQATNADNGGQQPIDAPNDSVPAKAYAIKLEYTMERRGGTGDQLDTHESGYVNEDKLISINVYSLGYFDSTHAAGNSLNDYFLVSPGGTIENKITNSNIGTGSNQGSDADSWNSFEYLMLMVEPEATGNYSFAIDIGMSDGRHLIDTTSVILY